MSDGAVVTGGLTVGNAQTTFNGPTTAKNNFMYTGAARAPGPIYGGVACGASNIGAVAVSTGFAPGTNMFVVCGADSNWWTLGGSGNLP